MPILEMPKRLYLFIIRHPVSRRPGREFKLFDSGQRSLIMMMIMMGFNYFKTNIYSLCYTREQVSMESSKCKDFFKRCKNIFSFVMNIIYLTLFSQSILFYSVHVKVSPMGDRIVRIYLSLSLLPHSPTSNTCQLHFQLWAMI